MVKIGNHKVERIYIRRPLDKPSYFVGQLVPSMQLINNPSFLLCDGHSYTYTTTQRTLLPTVITSSNTAPNLIERTVQSSNSNIGTTVNSTVLTHRHNYIVTNNNPAFPSTSTTIVRNFPYPQSYNTAYQYQSTGTYYSNYGGDRPSNTSKRTYVYWYLYIGEE